MSPDESTILDAKNCQLIARRRFNEKFYVDAPITETNEYNIARIELPNLRSFSLEFLSVSWIKAASIIATTIFIMPQSIYVQGR